MEQFAQGLTQENIHVDKIREVDGRMEAGAEVLPHLLGVLA
jgi:hypothetical protein